VELNTLELLDFLAQCQITILTFVTPHLVSSMDMRRRRIGYWVGLSSMPAWFFVAGWPDFKWGLMVANASYLTAYTKGLITHR